MKRLDEARMGKNWGKWRITERRKWQSDKKKEGKGMREEQRNLGSDVIR